MRLVYSLMCSAKSRIWIVRCVQVTVTCSCLQILVFIVAECINYLFASETLVRYCMHVIMKCSFWLCKNYVNILTFFVCFNYF
jgi:hypothetical protein